MVHDINDVIKNLSVSMDKARESADSQTPTLKEDAIQLNIGAYRALYYAALDAKRWLETFRETGSGGL